MLLFVKKPDIPNLHNLINIELSESHLEVLQHAGNLGLILGTTLRCGEYVRKFI